MLHHQHHHRRFPFSNTLSNKAHRQHSFFPTDRGLVEDTPPDDLNMIGPPGKPLKPEEFPIDERAVFIPNKIFYMRPSSQLSSTLHIIDVTDRVSLHNYDGSLIDTSILHHAAAGAKELEQSTHGVSPSASPDAYLLTKKSWSFTSFSLDSATRDGGSPPLSPALADDAPTAGRSRLQARRHLASLDLSLLRFGTWTFTFPLDSPHASHAVEMRTTGLMKKDWVLAIDSHPFFWVLEGNKMAVLYKVVGGKREPIGQWAKRHGYEKDCVFVLDSAQVDEVIAITSLCALVNRTDSF